MGFCLPMHACASLLGMSSTSTVFAVMFCAESAVQMLIHLEDEVPLPLSLGWQIARALLVPLRGALSLPGTVGPGRDLQLPHAVATYVQYSHCGSGGIIAAHIEMPANVGWHITPGVTKLIMQVPRLIRQAPGLGFI